MTSTSVQAVMKTRTTLLLVSDLKDHLTGEVLGVISKIRAASSRYRLTPLLTPLSAQHAETAGNREQRIRLDKLILQPTATHGNRCRRIVALEKVAGSSPVGHPLFAGKT